MLTFTQVKEMTAIPESEINNCLKFLCNPKNLILAKNNPKVPKFEPNEKVQVKTNFTNNNIRINFIPTKTHKKTEVRLTEYEE